MALFTDHKDARWTCMSCGGDEVTCKLDVPLNQTPVQGRVKLDEAPSARPATQRACRCWHCGPSWAQCEKADLLGDLKPGERFTFVHLNGGPFMVVEGLAASRRASGHVPAVDLTDGVVGFYDHRSPVVKELP